MRVQLLVSAAVFSLLVALAWTPIVSFKGSSPRSAHDDLARYEGFTLPSEELPLESYIDGVLQTLHVREGERFDKGDVLVSLDDDMQALAVEVARLRAQSVAEVSVAEARVAEAQVELESQQELAKTSSATPRDVRRAEAGLAVATAELEQAQENKLLAQKQYEIEQARLKLYTLRATFSGEVLSVATAQGAIEGAALRQNDPIMHLARLDPILAKVSLPESIVDQLKVGQQYMIAIGQRDAAVQARLTRVASVADRGSQLIEVQFEIPNSTGALRSGVRFRLLDTATLSAAKE